MITSRLLAKACSCLIVLGVLQFTLAAENYKKALQMANYFLECQESGHLSPGNRVPWRGSSHTNDGQDVGRDLSGGWYDAGDHWKTNNTMSDAALRIAWSAIEWPEAYTGSGQLNDLLENLQYVCDYFLKCVVDPNPDDTSSYDGYEVYIDVGGKPGPEPGVHSVWASPEVIEGYTVREALKGTSEYPAVDVAGDMAAAMAASAIVFDKHGSAEQKIYAKQLLKAARKLCIHSDRHFDNFKKNTVSGTSVRAVAPDGKARNIGYRSSTPHPALITGYAWVHRAEKALGTTGYIDHYAKRAIYYESEMNALNDNSYSWWSGFAPKFACLSVLTSGAALPPDAKSRMEICVEGVTKVWLETNPGDPNGVVTSPGGLRYRKNATNTFTIQRMLGPTTLCALWTTYRSGDTQKYLDYVQSQIDYILGNNPMDKSLLIGYDNNGSRDFWSVVHHRGAYGAWRTFEHFVSGKEFYRNDACRHILYGGFLLGVNAPHDSFVAKVMDHAHTEVALSANGNGQALLAFLLANGKGSGEPVPDQQFPPKAERNESTDMYTTDREFFVIAKMKSDNDDKVEIEAQMHNRTRWPARRTGGLTFRYYFEVDDGIDKEAIIGTISSSDVTAEIGDPVWETDRIGYVEISFPGDTIGPFVGNPSTKWCNYRKVTFTVGTPGKNEWNRSNDWSNDKLAENDALLTHFPVFHDGVLVGGEVPPGVVHAISNPNRYADKQLHPGITSVRIGKNRVYLQLNSGTTAKQWEVFMPNGKRIQYDLMLKEQSIYFNVPTPGYYIFRLHTENKITILPLVVH
jgi:endoglucanase